MGERGFRSTVTADLGRALADLGDHEGALRYAELSAELTPDGDVASEVSWRSTRALGLAGRGELGEAERLAREAVDLMVDSDFLFIKALQYEVLGQVLAAAGRRDEAAAAYGEAIALSERKQDVVSAKRVRRLRDELTAKA
jgi:tetratricopeptide (TPR) repeat protein